MSNGTAPPASPSSPAVDQQFQIQLFFFGYRL